MKSALIIIFAFASAVSVSAGELSPAMRLLFRSAKEQKEIEASQAFMDLTKAATEGIKIPLGSEELTLVLDNSRLKDSVLMKFNSTDASSENLLKRLQDDSVKAWLAERPYRKAIFKSYEAVDGSTVLQIEVYADGFSLIEHIIAVTQRYARNLPGAEGL